MTVDLSSHTLEVEKHSQPLRASTHRSYGSPPSSSPSSTSSSVFSADTLSQSSRSSASSITSSIYGAVETDVVDKPWLLSQRSQTFPPARGLSPKRLLHRTLPPVGAEIPAATEHRQHPRRSSTCAKQWQPPALVRQSERKGNFVDKLVDSATLIVEIIWPLSVPSCHEDSNVGRGVLPLRTFIQETLRRSRTSYSTLQVALYYLILIKAHVPGHDFTMEQPNDMQSFRALQCGRRMFLAALILASKYLQDRNYSARAWSKISGLRVGEINSNELTFCQAVNWNFHIPERTFDRWSDIVLKHTPSSQPPPPPGGISPKMGDWKVTIPLLTPGLGTVTVNPSNKEYARSEICSEAHKWVALDVPGDSRSLDTTPTPAKPPQYLEPKFDMAPPPPSLARLGLLPTPQLTPKSLMGANPPNSRHPSLVHGASKPAACSAMSRVQNIGMNSSSVEGWMQVSRPTPSEGAQYLRHKVSLAPPSIASSGSSPESMISDQLSRSSRASSISSVSSSTWGYQPNLARLATCRSANIPMTTHAENEPAKMTEGINILSGNNMYAEDAVAALEHLVFSDGPCAVNTPSPVIRRDSPVVVTAAKGGSHSPSDTGPRRSSARSRKRGRSSNDMSNLHQDVRALLRAPSPSLRLASSQLPAECKTPTCVEMVQRPDVIRKPSVTRRLPVLKELGRKRACCADEIYRDSPAIATVVSKATWQEGGMWGGVL